MSRLVSMATSPNESDEIVPFVYILVKIYVDGGISIISFWNVFLYVDYTMCLEKVLFMKTFIMFSPTRWVH